MTFWPLGICLPSNSLLRGLAVKKKNKKVCKAGLSRGQWTTVGQLFKLSKPGPVYFIAGKAALHPRGLAQFAVGYCCCMNTGCNNINKDTNNLIKRRRSDKHRPFLKDFFCGFSAFNLKGQLGEKGEREGENIQEILTGQIRTLDLCVDA